MSWESPGFSYSEIATMVEFGKEDPPEATTMIRTTIFETDSLPLGTKIAGGITVI